MEEDIEYITFDGTKLIKSDIRDEIINMYTTANRDGLTKITDFTIGSEAYHLADVIASFVLEHKENIDLNYRMSMIHTAEGEFLDNMGDMRGVHRTGASPSTGEVVFSRLSEDTSSPIVIPDGSQVATVDAISFIVDNDGEDLIIAAGATSASCNVLCEQEGEYTNVLANTIILVMGELGNLVSVTNPVDFTGGEDIEEDDDYRARILLSPFNEPTGSLAWYEKLSNELDSVHDTLVVKGETVADADVVINFNPTNREDTVTRTDLTDYGEDNSIEDTSNGIMTRARADLIDLFTMKEYDLVGVSKSFHLANIREVLVADANTDYYIGLLLESGYTLNNDLYDEINNIVEGYNDDAQIGLSFNPTVLSSLIENEVEGVQLCKIVSYDGSDYTELLEPVTVGATEVYHWSISDITEIVQLINFNIGV